MWNHVHYSVFAGRQNVSLAEASSFLQNPNDWTRTGWFQEKIVYKEIEVEVEKIVPQEITVPVEKIVKEYVGEIWPFPFAAFVSLE